jgi:hypothetical protein
MDEKVFKNKIKMKFNLIYNRDQEKLERRMVHVDYAYYMLKQIGSKNIIKNCLLRKVRS